MAGGNHGGDLFSLPARKRCGSPGWVPLDERRVLFASFDGDTRRAKFPSQDYRRTHNHRHRQHFQVLTREQLFVSIRRLAVTIFTVGALAAPASAMAQDPIVQGYGGRGPTVENQITPPGQVEAEVVSTPKRPTPTTTTPTESAPTA